MPDEATPAQSPRDLESELDKSRQSAARLMDDLAHKVGSNRTIRNATAGVQRAAQYVQAHSMKDVAADMERLLRRNPAYTIAIAMATGFLVGRAIRSR